MKALAATLLLSVLAVGLYAADTPALPYVYTKWKQFTVEDGLPNNHVFAVKVDGPRVWVGTEDGLAMLDKRTGKIKTWTEKDGLPWRVITAIDVDKKTGDVWLGLFGGGLARFSGGRFDHWHQLNSGLVNDVVYGVAVQDEYVWAATTAGASRFNTVTGEWTIFTEKNSPMEEIWNYSVAVGKGKVYLAVWGSGMLEYDLATGRWKDYLDPDGEMEIDLYRDDGIVHVIVTAASPAEDVVWVSSYFGACRYDGRHWRGFYNQDSGLASDFINNAKGRSADEAWFATDKGASAIVDFKTNTWVTYTRDPNGKSGKAVITRDKDVIKAVDLPVSIPHNFVINYDIDSNDIWIATADGLGWGIGEGYYPGLKQSATTISKAVAVVGGAQ
jgi:ligand-binding sensor domain-containing protein